MSMEASPRRRGVIKRAEVRVDAGDGGETRAPSAPLAAAEAAASGAHVPRARLIRLDERTQAIEFACPCGEVSLIEIQSENQA
jgi:hypothetical protein